MGTAWVGDVDLVRHARKLKDCTRASSVAAAETLSQCTYEPSTPTNIGPDVAPGVTYGLTGACRVNPPDLVRVGSAHSP